MNLDELLSRQGLPEEVRETLKELAEERRFREQFTVLHSVTLELTRCASPDELCRRAVELGRDSLGFGRLGLWFRDPEPGYIQGSFGIDEYGELRDERASRITYRHDSVVGEIFRWRYRWRRTESAPLFNHRAERIGTGVHVHAAVFDGAEVIGTLATDDLLAPGELTEARCELLALYAAALGHLHSRLRREEQHRTYIENAPYGILVADGDGRFLEANAEISRLTGYSVEELLRMTGADLRDREALAGRPTPHSVLLAEGRYRGDVPVLKKDGSKVLFSANAVRLSGGRHLGFYSDITEHRKTENALREALSFNEQIIAGAGEGILVTDRELRIRVWNPVLEQLSGMSAKDVVGRPGLEVTPGLKDFGLDLLIQRALAGETVAAPELPSVWPGGDPTRFVTRTFAPHRNSKGEIVGIVTILHDVTERKQAEEKLREALRFNEDIIAGAGEGIVVIDRDLRYRVWNPFMERLTGLPAGEVLGRQVFEVFPQFREQEIDHLLQRTLAGDTVLVQDLPLEVPQTGRSAWVTRTIAPHRDSEGAVIGAIVTLRDVTERRQAEAERRRLEAQVQRSQRLESLGVLAGGIAHDFNNILAGVMGFTEMSLLRLPPDHPVRGNLEQVLSGSRRARDLVQQILAFSRRAQMEQRPLRLEPLLKETLRFLRASLPSTIEIRQNFASSGTGVPAGGIPLSGTGVPAGGIPLSGTGVPAGGIPVGTVMADPTQIHQVLMNLCTNAQYAMRECGPTVRQGGVLEVTLEGVDLEADRAGQFEDVPPGRYVRLTVSDTGCGMDRETRDRIFEPFFTTKPVGEGSGMGLATSHGIIASHGGTITVYSEPGVGTTFRIYLPCIAEEEKPPEPSTADAIPRGGERILFVDDEEMLAFLGEQLLSSLGYRVTAMTSSAEALKLFREDPGAFDLVLSDQTMPQMTGLDLAAALREIRPELPILLMTGFSQRIDPDRAEGLGLAEPVLKPYGARQLGEAVRRALQNAE